MRRVRPSDRPTDRPASGPELNYMLFVALELWYPQKRLEKLVYFEISCNSIVQRCWQCRQQSHKDAGNSPKEPPRCMDPPSSSLRGYPKRRHHRPFRGGEKIISEIRSRGHIKKARKKRDQGKRRRRGRRRRRREGTRKGTRRRGSRVERRRRRKRGCRRARCRERS